MKKILLLVIAITLVLNTLAQSDGFFNDWYDVDSRNVVLPELPNSHGDLYNSDAAPAGSGVLILTAIGIGYAALKRKDSESS